MQTQGTKLRNNVMNSHEVQIVKDYNIWAVTKSETLDKPISSVEIYNLSKKLKNKKTSSVDSLSNEIIKLAVKALPLYSVKILTSFYQKEYFLQLGLMATLFRYINRVIRLTLVIIEEYVSVAAWGNFSL